MCIWETRLPEEGEIKYIGKNDKAKEEWGMLEGDWGFESSKIHLNWELKNPLVDSAHLLGQMDLAGPGVFNFAQVWIRLLWQTWKDEE